MDWPCGLVQRLSGCSNHSRWIYFSCCEKKIFDGSPKMHLNVEITLEQSPRSSSSVKTLVYPLRKSCVPGLSSTWVVQDVVPLLSDISNCMCASVSAYSILAVFAPIKSTGLPATRKIRNKNGILQTLQWYALQVSTSDILVQWAKTVLVVHP